MQIKQFEYVCEIARSGSITQAADKLYISRQALSESLRLLEQELGFEIFQRSNKGILPTSEGKIFLEGLDQILPIVNSWDELAKKEKIKVKVLLHIVNDTSLAAIDGISNITVEWENASGTEILKKIEESTANIGIMLPTKHGPTYYKMLELTNRSHDIVCEVLTETKICIAFSPDDPLCKKEKLYLSDLHGKQLVRSKVANTSSAIQRFVKLTGNEGYILPEAIDYFDFLLHKENTFALLPERSIQNNIYVQKNMVTIRYLSDYDNMATYYLLYHLQQKEVLNPLLEQIKTLFH